jgi:TolB protein
MAELKELFEMATKQAEPDLDSWKEQEQRQRRTGRRRKLGTFAMAAAIGVGAIALILVMRPGENATTAGTAPTDAAQTAVSGPVTPPNDRDYVLDLNTGVMTPLPGSIIRSLAVPAGPDPLSPYAASPDGSRLAFVGAGDDGNPQIFVAGIDGTGVRQMTHDPTGATYPAWSPDGTAIAYTGYGSGGVPSLFVLEVATGGSTQITDGGHRPENGLQFTPDGSSLLYTGRNVLMTLPIAGGESTLLFGPVGNLDGAWDGSMSPDGSLVTYLASGHDSEGVYGGAWRRVANADGTGSRTILGCYGLIPSGAWSPDGSQIVCSMGPGNPTRIIVVDIATLDAERVARGSEAIWLDDHTLLVDA